VNVPATSAGPSPRTLAEIRATRVSVLAAEVVFNALADAATEPRTAVTE
jgi:hypothetical protein